MKKTLLNTFKYTFSVIFLFMILVSNNIIAQTHKYNFNNSLTEVGGIGPSLTEVLSCAATAGNFNNQSIVTTAGSCGSATVFSFTEGGGFSYPNNPAFINDTYTIHVFFKFDV